MSQGRSPATPKPVAAHTPGPWEVHSIGMGYSIRGDGNGHCVAFTNTASCSRAALRNGVTKDAEEQANARLLAAAPDMRDALVLLDKRLRECMGDPISAAEAYDTFYQDIIAEAIKKARGEE